MTGSKKTRGRALNLPKRTLSYWFGHVLTSAASQCDPSGKEADDQSYLLWWGDPSMLQSACRVLLATSCSLWAWTLSIEKLAWMGEWGMLHRVRLERCYTSLGPFVFYSRWLTSCWNAVGLSAAVAIFGISCTRGYLSLCLLLSIQQT